MAIPKFLEKLLGDTFKDISNRRWFDTLYWYIIDSKEKTQQRLDLFLKNQIDNPDKELVDLAKRFAQFKNPDRIIVEILKYVYARVQYRYDDVNFGKVEYWATAKETLERGYDDCDGLNGLIYVLMRLASSEIINNYLLCCIGDVKEGGHFWLIYFSPKTGKWYPIDGTYHPDLRDINKGRKEFMFDSERYKNVWFYFNEKFILKQR